jgi:hypothetical protein
MQIGGATDSTEIAVQFDQTHRPDALARPLEGNVEMTRTWARGAAATAVAANALFIVTPPAYGEEGTTMPLPCSGAEYLFTPTGHITDATKERVDDGRYHESSIFILGVVATPAEGDGSTYSGRIAYLHSANDGTTGNGHAVSTMRQLATLHGSDGSVLLARSIAHITATARPDDPSAVIRLFFEHSTCIEVSR